MRFLFLLAALFPAVALAEPSAEEMAPRAKVSLASDSAYEMESIKAFWGDASFLRQCLPPHQSTPEPFVIYFEVLPSGELGATVFEPLTNLAKCIQAHTVHRVFPKPPGTGYVTRIVMSFDKGGT